MDYEELKQLVINFCDKYLKGREDYYLVAIMRGGLTPAHIAAKYLRKNLGVIRPGEHIVVYHSDIPCNKDLIFFDDVVAQGRTYNLIANWFRLHNYNYKNVDWMFAPVVVDTHFDDSKYPNVYPMYRSEKWIVFPWEEEEKIISGDRSLFREKEA